jgi:hypothetical protein
MGRMGVVELFVDIERGRHPTLAAAIMGSIRRDAKARQNDVLSILRDERLTSLDLIMFPGWTLVGNDLPNEMIKAAANRTVVIEMLPPETESVDRGKGESGKVTSIKAAKGSASSDEEVPWRTYVLHRGRKLGPFSQRLITSGHAGVGNTPSQRTHMLMSELAGRERSWSPGSSLWICGEVNALYGGGRGGNVVPWIEGFPTNWKIVANPAHTPNRLQAMRDKRKHLSAAGVLLTTANTHSPWVDSKGQRQNAGRTAAEIYREKKRLNLNSTGGNAPTMFKMGDHRVVVIETR